MSEVREKREVTVTQEVAVRAFCDRCNADIPFAYTGLSGGPSNPKNAARVVMAGWYGGFIDWDDESSLLCESCCEKLCAFMGWVNRLAEVDPPAGGVS